jgi:hypothetical protein
LPSKTLNIFSDSFDTYADALYGWLEHNGIEKVWLAKKITPEGQKVVSTQEKLSRWKREGSKPAQKTRNKISGILGIKIDSNRTGKWHIVQISTDDGKGQSLPKYPIDELLKEERLRLGVPDIPDTERGRELQDMLNNAVSLLLRIYRSIEKEKNRSD